MVLIATTGASAVVAFAMGQPVWAALVGGGLVLAYWGLEALTWRRARERRDLALGLAVRGMVARVALVVGVLILIGVLARPAFAAAALAFLAAFTVYVTLRLFVTYPQASGPAGTAGVQ